MGGVSSVVGQTGVSIHTEDKLKEREMNFGRQLGGITIESGAELLGRIVIVVGWQ
jgi:hypothetical protein